MDDFVESYITCNPPLLPNGVASIIERAQVFVNNAVLAEILYEPDVPWFKCITTRADRERVTKKIQDWLLTIMNEDTIINGVNAGVPQLIEVVQDAAQLDIAVVAEGARIMPWAEYKSQGDDSFKPFDRYRFPETMAHLKFKTIWRGIEEWEGGTFDSLLAAFGRFVRVENRPVSADDFADLVGCQAVSYNMKENLVYLGSDKSLDVMDDAIQRLTNILAFVVQNPRCISHLLFLERQGPLRIIYRWMSHVGLSRATYAQTSSSPLADEYRLLLGAATLRTESLNEHGTWLADRTVYPLLPPSELSGPSQPHSFDPFRGYAFRSKSIEGASLGVHQPAKMLTQIAKPSPLQSSADTYLEAAAKAAMTSAPSCEYTSKMVPELTVNQDHIGLRIGDPEEVRPAKVVHPDPLIDRLPHSTSADDDPSAKRIIHRWINEVESANKPDEEEDLISFDAGDDAAAGCAKGDADTHADTGKSVGQKPSVSDLCDDLICFDSEPEQDGSQGGLEKKFAANSNVAPLNIPGLDEDPIPVVKSGLLEEERAGTSQTMNRKAGRDTGRATLSPSKKEEKKGKKKVIMGPGWSGSPTPPKRAWVTPKPVTQPQGSKAEEQWPGLGTAALSLKEPKKPIGCNPLTIPLNVCAQPDPSTFPTMQHQGNEHSTELSTRWNMLPDLNADLPVTKEDLAARRDMMDKIKAEIQDFVSVLRLTPGQISLELVFGRIYLKQFSPSQVYSEAGSSFEPDETVEFLNAPEFRQDLAGFSPVLTTAAEDANRLSLLQPAAGSQWQLFDKQTWYDFICVFNDGQKPFVVRVDAEGFDYHIEEARQDVSSLYLHCPRRAWDIKVCARRLSALQGMARHESFAKALVSALTVSNQGGDLVIGTPGTEKIEGRLESVKIRQRARYRDKGGSELNVCMITVMEKEVRKRRPTEMAWAKGERWVPQKGNGKAAIPCRWFEATIASPRATELFAPNQDLKFGQMACWDEDKARMDEIVNHLCQPALAMIGQMDLIGRANNNGQRLDARDAFHDGMMERGQGRRGEQYVFW